MDAIPSSIVQAASAADLGSVQGAAALSVLRKANALQGASALQLVASVPTPPPPPAPSPSSAAMLGGRLDVYA